MSDGGAVAAVNDGDFVNVVAVAADEGVDDDVVAVDEVAVAVVDDDDDSYAI